MIATRYRHLFRAASVLPIVFAAGCGMAPAVLPDLPTDIPGDMHHVLYDVIAVNVETSLESRQTLAVEGKGQATKDGFKAMAAAPIGCMGAGMYAGLCYGIMPILPIITAIRAEDPAVARAELEAFYARIEEYGLQSKMKSRLLQRLADESLTVASAGSDEPAVRVVTMNVFTAPMQLEHSGYKKGYIDVTLVYTIELVDGTGELLARRSGRVMDDFSQSSRSTTLYPVLDAWLDGIVEQSVSKMLLEWQPEVVLGYTYPGKVEKKTFFGRKYLDWSPVDSLTPRLEWQRLDETVAAERMSDITDLSYELEILGYVSDGTYAYKPRHIVRVTGLQDSFYQLDTELLPCQRYYWQPKARFSYRGTMRTTTMPERYALITSGPGCKSPRWLLPETPVLPDSIVGAK